MLDDSDRTGQGPASPSSTTPAPAPGSDLLPEDEANEPFDREAVLARVEGNLLVLEELIGMFREDCPKWMTDIRDSIQQGDAPRLQRAAHTLRGAVANFGAGPAQQTAQVLELMGRGRDLTGAAEALLVLEAAMQRLQPALDRVLEPSIR